MIELAKNTINNVPVELTVEETIGSELGGYPTLRIGECPIESVMVQEVDTLAMIKAIITSKTISQFQGKIDEVWGNERIVATLKSFALAMMEGNEIIADTPDNLEIVREIEFIADSLKDDDLSPKIRTVMEAEMWDLHQKLEVIE